MGMGDLIYASMTFLELSGESFWILDLDGPGIAGIWPTHPKHWEPVVQGGMVTGWKYQPKRGVEGKIYPAEEVAFFR
jgi:hypothetical protein